MPNQKISELTAIVTVDNSVDVLPIVDISANTTKKVTPNALKTALALDNVNNTSDANKPVSIAQQDALNAKVDENAAITPATKTKITYDAKGLVTSGDSLDETDLPTGINANKIGTGVVSTTEFEYLNGVTSAIQTQINSKQATLVSGTNIKTINSTSLLGSGDITISASPSGVSGAIQFSDGSAFASDAANFFWNNTTKRLGIGTNTPASALDVNGTADGVTAIRFKSQFSAFGTLWSDNTQVGICRNFRGTGGNACLSLGAVGVGVRTGGDHTAVATLDIKGSGSTSATTSLLVQNSAGNTIIQAFDDRTVNLGGNSVLRLRNNDSIQMFATNGYEVHIGSGSTNYLSVTSAGTHIKTGSGAPVASAILDVDSTTKGFLPPRMTTTQKNAIASPAAGLVVYDSTTNKLQCYNGSTWNDLF